MTMPAENPNPAAAGGQPAPAAATPAAQATQAPAPPAPAPAAQAQPEPARAPATRKLLDGEGDGIPDDAETFEISRSNFKKRFERMSKAQLKAQFGTDNVDEILAWRQRAEDASKREEEQKLAQMTEADRNKAKWEKAANEASHWKTQYETLQQQQQWVEQDRRVTGIVAKHVDPECIEFVSQKLAAHLQGLEDDELRDPQAYVDEWCAAYVKTNPRFGVQRPEPALAGPAPAVPGMPVGVQQLHAPGAPPRAAAATPAARQVPFSNGPGNQRPATAAQPPMAKTLVPGLPNSMTDAEAREYYRQHGFSP